MIGGNNFKNSGGMTYTMDFLFKAWGLFRNYFVPIVSLEEGAVVHLYSVMIGDKLFSNDGVFV
jgi:hypothetical protein